MEQIVLHYREVIRRQRDERTDRIEDLSLALRRDAADIVKSLRGPDGGS